MKTGVQRISGVPGFADSPKTSFVAAVCELFKLRLTSLMVFTTFAGFYMGLGPIMRWRLMFDTLVGTAFLAGGAAAFNQVMERKQDARMQRTEKRPLPSRRLRFMTAVVIGGSCAAMGLVYLGVRVGLLCGGIGAVALIVYLFAYTPLKRVTQLNTLVGAIPGALPVLMGWTAVRGEVSAAGLALFALVWIWQMPHFIAIGWLYRSEFENAGLNVLASSDSGGRRSGVFAVLNVLCLLLVSVCPFLLGLSGLVYLVGACIAGVGFLWCAIRFAQEPSPQRAWVLFHASILYLPLLLGLMMAGKTKGNVWAG